MIVAGQSFAAAGSFKFHQVLVLLSSRSRPGLSRAKVCTPSFYVIGLGVPSNYISGVLFKAPVVNGAIKLRQRSAVQGGVLFKAPGVPLWAHGIYIFPFYF
jgi:hypothetical protein